MVKQKPKSRSNAAARLTLGDLKNYASYDPRAGLFTRIKDGKVLGTTSQGRVVISVKGDLHLAHRLAWLYVHGEWPNGILDHKDRDPANNRIDNLRLATKAENVANSTSTRTMSGLRGVYYQSNTNLWRVKIARINVGYFETKEAANEAYKAKAQELYGEFAVA